MAGAVSGGDSASLTWKRLGEQSRDCPGIDKAMGKAPQSSLNTRGLKTSMEVQVARLEEIPPNTSFQESIGILTRYLEPFRAMWPYYWLKAVAVYDPAIQTWQLCRFLLAGRWNEIPQVEQIDEEGSALAIVSQMIDADTAWAMLLSLQETGAARITANITAFAGTANPTFPPTWQEPYPVPANSELAAVAEQTTWRYLHADPARWWSAAGDSENRLLKAVLPDLHAWGERDIYSWRARWLNEPLQGGFYLSEIRCEYDFPLAFGVERAVPDRMGGSASLTLRLSCRHPLALDSLQVISGARWSSRAPVLPIDGKHSAGEWSFGQVTIPHREARVWFKFAELARPLLYELVVPTVEDQVAEVVRAIYGKGSVEQGNTRWQEDLLTATGEVFEVALLNAIARCGLPVLFAGRLSDGGPETPGYDLVVVDHARRRLAVISAKGESGGNPSNKTYKNLDAQLQVLKSLLVEWDVTGIVAMHTPNAILGPSKQRTEMRVWSLEDVEQLYHADTREQVEALLWPPLAGLRLLGRT